jgi:hypothetical protein
MPCVCECVLMCVLRICRVLNGIHLCAQYMPGVCPAFRVTLSDTADASTEMLDALQAF